MLMALIALLRGVFTKKSPSTLHEVNLKTISPRLLLTFFTGGEVTKYPPA